MAGQLPSWNEGATKRSITDFVDRVTRAGSPDFVPPEERIATYDNDGTLWCEKPLPIQLDFILRHFATQAERDATLRAKQPWKAAYEKDFTWLSGVIERHYHGDDTDVKVLLGGLGTSFGGVMVEDYERLAHEFVNTATHPKFKRSYSRCTYKPMVELLRYLEANGFTNYITSGGDRDFMRPFAGPIYGIPPHQVIGSSFGLSYREDENGGTVVYEPHLDTFDDGPEKPVRIWSRIGRRPLLASGNSNGDVPMLNFAGGPSRPALRLLVLHDDAEREYEYVSGAENALERAKTQGWTVISMKNDWSTVFAE